MGYKTTGSLRRAMASAGLPAPADLPEMTVAVIEAKGRLHSAIWSCGVIAYKELQSAATRPAALAEVLASPPCEKCDRFFASGVGVSTLWQDVMTVCEIAKDIRSARRVVAEPGRRKTVAATTKLSDRLTAQQSRIAAILTGPSAKAMGSDLHRISDELVEAVEALRSHIVGDEQRDLVVARVLADMIPQRLRGRVLLEDTPTLVAIVPMVSCSRRVREVIDAFTVETSAAATVVVCPRFVVDYINRYFTAGHGDWSNVILTASTVGYDEAVVRAAVALLDPLSDGPLADPAGALAAAALMAP